MCVEPSVPDPTPFEAVASRQCARFLAFSSQRRTYGRTHFQRAVADLPDPDRIDQPYLLRAFGGLQGLEAA
nr:hypothetical protein [Streptomyces sp. SID5468]